MSWPDQPVVYEINTAVWLTDLSRAHGRRVTLRDVAGEDWDTIAASGVDAVWLMGVWERSPAGVRSAQTDLPLMAWLHDVLPDLGNADVIGSPYSVRRYDVDTRFGGFQGLATARRELAVRGIRLVLDYSPDHVAPDHPWVTQHPERFVTDTLELDAFAPAVRVATSTTLSDIADHCDGIKCDRADLMMNRVFAKTWGDRASPEPLDEFWPAVCVALRANHPEIVLFAEACCDMEWDLLQQGFDFCYDKCLHDRLLSGDVGTIRDHLRADLSFQARMLRFLENHDEPRVAAKLSSAAERAAAVCIATLPGATLWQEGQFEARRVRPPALLGRRPDEPPDRELRRWHERLIGSVRESHMRSGTWQLLDVAGWPGNCSSENLLAWCWYGEMDGQRHVVVVNYSGSAAQARVRIPWGDLGGGQWRMTELLTGDQFLRDGDELAAAGLYVDLPGWGVHVLATVPESRAGK